MRNSGAKGAPGKRKALGDDSPLEGKQDLVVHDEYEEDSSDEEDIRNTVGNIPMEWYQDFPHIGYDLDGKKIYKPLRSKDELDLFLEKMENPEYWRTVQDRQTGAEVPLSEEQLELIRRLQRGHFGDVNFDPYERFSREFELFFREFEAFFREFEVFFREFEAFFREF
ncbi:ribosome biogenesis protein bop1-like [Anomalospiza imberbis]|uniref:ribosome biogenesis protein bop1-like n=1 Tax=Anomalospiza imberbis TaxID=187417 RepID=UPI00358E92A3